MGEEVQHFGGAKIAELQFLSRNHSPHVVNRIYIMSHNVKLVCWVGLFIGVSLAQVALFGARGAISNRIWHLL